MNNDLISRSALKNEIDTWGCNDYDKYDFLEAIDNAPTVEPTFGMFREMLCSECEKNCTECKEKRPHGKWVEKVETKQLGHGWLTTHEIVCSVCGGSGENDENIPQCWKFCPNCGADMRQEESEK